MKRIIITILVFFTGMTVFAQSSNLSYYTEEYNRSTATFIDRLEVLQTVREANLTDIGEFYHDALKVLITKLPDIKTKPEKDAAEASARILCQELGSEGYTAAAPELWYMVQFFDVVRAIVGDLNNGLTMQDALVALGQVNAKDYAPHIALRLDNFNTDHTTDVETRRRVQRGVVGCISALEALHEIIGYKPVFFAYVGWYDPAIKSIASAALPNIVEDPGEVIAEIIRDPANNPSVKFEAWREMLRTRAPSTSKAKVASVALGTGWTFATSIPEFQRNLREMRMSAIDTIRMFGVEDDSVYTNLERSYNNNFVNASPSYDEIRRTIDALSTVKTDEAVNLLLKFLRELHARRRSGPWGNKERQVLQMVIPALGATGTQSQDVRQLLTTIQRSSDYTGNEQTWARNALRDLGQ